MVYGAQDRCVSKEDEIREEGSSGCFGMQQHCVNEAALWQDSSIMVLSLTCYIWPWAGHLGWQLCRRAFSMHVFPCTGAESLQGCSSEPPARTAVGSYPGNLDPSLAWGKIWGFLKNSATPVLRRYNLSKTGSQPCWLFTFPVLGRSSAGLPLSPLHPSKMAPSSEI